MKKIISVLLCICMAFTVCTVAFAQPSEGGTYVEAASVEDAAAQLAKSGNDYPLVICPGINHSPVYVCDDNGDYILNEDGNPISETLLLTKTNKLVPCIIKYAAVPLILSLIFQKDCGLCSGIKKVADEVFSYQKTYADGSHEYNLKLKDFHFPLSKFDENSFDGKYDREWFYRQLPIQKYTEKAGEDEVYLYTFNLVGNVMESAAGLDEFIQFVKKETGSDKVNLLNVSLGGTVFTAYMDKYVDKGDVNEVVNVVAVLDGTKIIGDFLKRDWNLGDESVYKTAFPYIMGIEAESELLGYVINLAIRIMPKELLGGIITSFYESIYYNILINTSQVWAMIPSSYYPELAEKYLADDEHATLRASTEEFYHAQLNLVDNIKRFKAQGGEISFICGYGLKFGDEQYSFFSLVASYDKVNSDGIIQIESTSLGATSVPAGQTLSDEYIAGVANKKYIAPNKSLDASTCAFPDNVWFFENQHHEIGGNDVALGMASEILCYDDIKDVNSMPDKYPQFNGTRNTKWVNRSYMPAYNEMDRSLYTEEQLARADAAVEATKAMMQRTVIDSANDNKVVKELQDSLADMDLVSSDDGPSALETAGTFIAKLASDLVYKFVGPKGYFE